MFNQIYEVHYPGFSEGPQANVEVELQGFADS